MVIKKTDWLRTPARNLLKGLPMEIGLLCKVIGGLLAGIAHRYIVRVARREGISCFLAAMLLPGFSLVFAFIHRVDLKRALIVQLTGFALLGAAFAIRVTAPPVPPAVTQREMIQPNQPKTPKKDAPTPESDRAAQFAQMTPEQKQERLKTWYQALETRRKDLKNAQEINAFNLEAQQYHALLSEVSPNMAADKSRAIPAQPTGGDAEQLARRAKWYQELRAKRDKLDPKNPEAIVAFNAEVARYQASATASEDTHQGAPLTAK